MSKDNLEIRNEIKEWITRSYLGPLSQTKDKSIDLNEKINFSPKEIYSTGQLHPQENNISENSYEADYEDYLNANENDSKKNIKTNYQSESTEDEMKLTTNFYPSSIAISFIHKKNNPFDLNVNFGKYVKVEDNEFMFERIHYTFNCIIELGTNNDLIIKDHSSEWNMNSTNNKLINFNSISSDVKIRLISREVKDISIVTISLINNISKSGSDLKKNENLIFQPKIIVESNNGIQSLPDKANLESLNDEDIDAKFLYRKYKNYGMGHGCSVDWLIKNNVVKKIESKILPDEIIKGVDFEPVELKDNDDILFMKNLTDIDSTFKFDKLIDQLESFVNIYSNWIEKQKKESNAEKLEVKYKESSKRLINKCEELKTRMLNGIKLLKHEEVLRSFLDANKAMFYQRVLSDFSKHRERTGRVLSNDDKKDDYLPDFSKIPFDSLSNSIWNNGELELAGNNKDSKFYLAKWRPFQLAFLLSQLEGVIDEKSTDRDTIDLLWFSTGGGKTEAYLGLIAFTIFYNRIKNKSEDHGVNIMMRYTLRMLNLQQFSRANVLITSCELIRFNNVNLYGETRISNGLWIGRSASSPNTNKDNSEKMQKYMRNYDSNYSIGSLDYTPPVSSCPCCGNKLLKEIQKNDSGNPESIGRWGYSQIINKFKGKPFRQDDPFYMFCTNTKCHFHISIEDFKLNKNEDEKINEKSLPIYFVDENIYIHKPTLLFSTVDKYAQLAWNDNVFKLFNYDDNFERKTSPPTLIIQDELHLISSSLGTVYSMFEFVIDELCKNANGCRPKIIGATATAKNAKEQCLKIYNRTNFSQFPPFGIDIDDSFFSRKKENDPNGRIYIGVMPSGLTATTAKLRLDSLIIDGINKIQDASNTNLDNYYTLLAYFNTIKELGKYRTLLEDDMKGYRKFLAEKLSTLFINHPPDRIKELSSQMNSADITIGLDSLEKDTLNEIDQKDPIVRFLNGIGVRTSRDIQISRYGNNWLKIIKKNWNFLSEYIDLDEDVKKYSEYPSKWTDDERNMINDLIDKCAKLFTNRLNSELKDENIDPVKVALSTNMISVGVDIPRLNVMSISGQPKTTAEYIQASSRVGREKPGIVFTLYNQAKNRDRSHYEGFKDYHQSYYKHVESTSVTPFSLPAIEKTIDSIIIILSKIRYYKGSKEATMNDEVEQIINKIGLDLIDRFSSIQKNLNDNDVDFEKRKKSILSLTKEVIDKWKRQGVISFTTYNDLRDGRNRNEENLSQILFVGSEDRNNHLTQEKLFVMSSLRDVDTSSEIKIKSYIT